MKTSVVVVCYNNVELVERTVQSVLDHSVDDWELIVVDNHSLDERTREYIQSILHEKVKYVDAGKNIGCHQGFNLGFKHATGDVLVKLDDDSSIVTPGWNKIMIDTLKDLSDMAAPEVAFLGVDSNARQVTNGYKLKTTGGKNVEIITSGVLGFSLVMIPSTTYEKFGPLESRFWGDGVVKKDSLYGGEELYYCQKAIQNEMIYGYCNSVRIHHADNALRDPDYVAWKYGGGYLGWFGYDLNELKKHPDMLRRVYSHWVCNEKNDWYVSIGNKRLKELQDE